VQASIVRKAHSGIIKAEKKFTLTLTNDSQLANSGFRILGDGFEQRTQLIHETLYILA
jgi:hypothetical protein